MNPLFTVIVPSYKCEPFLAQTLGSLDEQTFRDFEVLLVVEHSPDKSLEICRKWAEGKNATISELPISGGVGASRNWGFDHANGQYIFLLDGDDWLAPETLQEIATAIQQNNYPEIVQIGMQSIFENDDGTLDARDCMYNLHENESGHIFSGFEFIRAISRTGHHAKSYAQMSVCRLDFLRKFDLYQRPELQSEDSEWSPRVWLSASTILFLARPFYKYRRHDGSITSQNTTKILYSTASISIYLGKFFSKLDLPFDIHKQLDNDALSIFNWYLFHKFYAKRFTDHDRKQALKMVLDKAEDAAAYCSLWNSASRFKRWGLPFILFAHKTGILFPAVWYFRYFYYPMTKLKG